MLNIGFGKLVTWVTGLKSKFANIIFDIEFCLFYQFLSFFVKLKKKNLMRTAAAAKSADNMVPKSIPMKGIL